MLQTKPFCWSFIDPWYGSLTCRIKERELQGAFFRRGNQYAVIKEVSEQPDVSLFGGLANGNVSAARVGPSNGVTQDYMGVMSSHFLCQYSAIFGARGKGIVGCGSGGVVGLSNTSHWNDVCRNSLISQSLIFTHISWNDLDMEGFVSIDASGFF
uniref:Uncharacterized protein n=1 Tax=Tanacetum cinerariifolium TaxID=118510 RepID=A0A6L2KGN3_TANCI|nr:hypothetical protein [Tanacetum cinerariifolium]